MATASVPGCPVIFVGCFGGVIRASLSEVLPSRRSPTERTRIRVGDGSFPPRLSRARLQPRLDADVADGGVVLRQRRDFQIGVEGIARLEHIEALDKMPLWQEAKVGFVAQLDCFALAAWASSAARNPRARSAALPLPKK